VRAAEAAEAAAGQQHDDDTTASQGKLELSIQTKAEEEE
jgi:hypothetical protein